ncbi:hypothetical protein ACFQS6_10630 [Xanthomonas populi]|uniref:hypothetical protein n=1 Tax=Xanthomonas populi TaxID=53414 RepID=UPI001FC92322|nr:hypothetical protein [Xanthomonas populi]
MLSAVPRAVSVSPTASMPWWRRAAAGLCLLGVAVSTPLAAQDPVQVNTVIGS